MLPVIAALMAAAHGLASRHPVTRAAPRACAGLDEPSGALRACFGRSKYHRVKLEGEPKNRTRWSDSASLLKAHRRRTSSYIMSNELFYWMFMVLMVIL